MLKPFKARYLKNVFKILKTRDPYVIPIIFVKLFNLVATLILIKKRRLNGPGKLFKAKIKELYINK